METNPSLLWSFCILEEKIEKYIGDGLSPNSTQETTLKIII